MSNYRIERVTEGALLGEGPHWDSTTQSLYFVDILKKSIHKYTPSTKTFTSASTGNQQPSIIIPIAGRKNEFIISLDNTITKIFWDGKSDRIDLLDVLAKVDTGTKNKFNDGKCDNSGRLWAGTLELNIEHVEDTPAKGHLYSMTGKGPMKAHRHNIQIANGLAWNDDIGRMYYIDSMTGRIDQYDYDKATGTIDNCRPLFTLAKHNIPGLPDGMTIDSDGNLWVAIFNGSRIIKVSTEEQDVLLETIKMPAKQVTSVTFGGENLDELYVTTGSFPNEGEVLLPPENGATYKISGVGAIGTVNASFRAC